MKIFMHILKSKDKLKARVRFRYRVRVCEDVYCACDQNPLLCTLKIKICTASKCPVSIHTWQENSQGSKNMTSRNRMKFKRVQLGPE